MYLLTFINHLSIFINIHKSIFKYVKKWLINFEKMLVILNQPEAKLISDRHVHGDVSVTFDCSRK